MKSFFFFVFLPLIAFVYADLPVHCLYSQTKGDWEFKLTAQDKDSSVVKQCGIRTDITPTETLRISLQVPNIVVDQSGNKGTWTLIYDQGFEVIINNNKYFAFFNYTEVDNRVISNCHQTFTGWYHEVGVAAKKWGCYRGYKVQSTNEQMQTTHEYSLPKNDASVGSKMFQNDMEYINAINAAQSSWEAAPYPEFEKMTINHMTRQSGKVIPQFKVDARKAHMAQMRTFRDSIVSYTDIPKSFDWRNVSGQDFVSPVRNQGGCGSCYAFAATAMFEARMRVATKNQKQPVYSPQEIVSCSSYAQACDGGFPYLISKYAEDFGIVEEHCYPYQGFSANCTQDKCPGEARRHFTDYHYIGGYYGATTVPLMQENILKYGPIATSFEVLSDFRYYKKGVYRHTKLVNINDPEPFVVTNHVVLITGWSETEDGTPYWIVKNSWGSSWGMSGYFWILRGNDEVGIESLVPSAVPVL
jgi:cathepsin C